MTDIAFNLTRYFESEFFTTESFLETLSPIEVVNTRNMFLILETEEFDENNQSIEDEVEEEIQPSTPLPDELELLFNLSYEGDRLPIFIDECDPTIQSPIPTYPVVVETQSSSLAGS